MLLAGRVIGGVACGIVFSICPTYASEVASPAIRGRVGAFYKFVFPALVFGSVADGSCL